MADNKQKKTVQKEESKGFVFSIMPFGGFFDQYYQNIYCPAIKEAGLDFKRADDLYRPSTIVNDIWAYTKDCKLILADLTGKNPNVLYELGLAHAIAKPGIIITENLEDIPFDLRALRIIEYDKNHHDWGQLLKEKITKAINEVLSSPLKAVLPTFLEVDVSKGPKKVTASDKQIIEMSQEIDALRREIRHFKSSRSDRLDPESIIVLIEEAIRKNYRISTEALINKFSKYGPPAQWIVNESQKIREKIDEEIPF